MTFYINNTSLTNLPRVVAVPKYNRDDLEAGILHIGIGNFHRAHMGTYLDKLFETTECRDWAIVGAGVRTADNVMRDKLAKQDWMNLVVDLDPKGLSARVTGGMVDFLPIDPTVILKKMSDPKIRIVSLTVTEGGYFLDGNGQFDIQNPDIVADSKMPDTPTTVFGLILAALRKRRANDCVPFTIMSCDNLPKNGETTRRTVIGLAKLYDLEFASWIENNVAFPNSMVDCITPATTEREHALVIERFGIEDLAPVVCEPFRQWVIEDNFTAGRPPLEKVGVTFASDVSQYELMKLRILNGSHASICYAGALLGHQYIHEAIVDPDIIAWLKILQIYEIIPTLPQIKNVNYNTYLNSVIARFSNSEMGDTISRNAADGSDRQPKFILSTLRDALANGGNIQGLALEVALWAKYLRGINEKGEKIEIKDSQVDELYARAVATITRPMAFLENSSVFTDLAKNRQFSCAFVKWIEYLNNKGVRETLRYYVASTGN